MENNRRKKNGSRDSMINVSANIPVPEISGIDWFVAIKYCSENFRVFHPTLFREESMDINDHVPIVPPINNVTTVVIIG